MPPKDVEKICRIIVLGIIPAGNGIVARSAIRHSIVKLAEVLRWHLGRIDGRVHCSEGTINLTQADAVVRQTMALFPREHIVDRIDLTN